MVMLVAPSPDVDVITFTGSTPVGRQIMAAASETVKRVFLELGGKSAAIVLDDADFANATMFAAFSMVTHAGQGCALTSRLLVPRKHHDEIVELVAQHRTTYPIRIHSHIPGPRHRPTPRMATSLGGTRPRAHGLSQPMRRGPVLARRTVLRPSVIEVGGTGLRERRGLAG